VTRSDQIRKKLEENRRLILLLEISALIHDIGKLSSEFLDGTSLKASKKQRGFRHHLVTKPVDLDKLAEAFVGHDIFRGKTVDEIKDEIRNEIKQVTRKIDDSRFKHQLQVLMLSDKIDEGFLPSSLKRILKRHPSGNKDWSDYLKIRSDLYDISENESRLQLAHMDDLMMLHHDPELKEETMVRPGWLRPAACESA